MSTKDGCAAVHVHVWYLQLRRTSVTWRSNFRAESSVKPRSDWQVSGASFLAPENLCKKTCASYTFTLRKFLVQESGYTPKILCYNKESLEKSDLQSIVQSAAEFHDRNLPEIEHVLFLPVSGTSFLCQKNGTRNPVHTGKFSGARNLRQKLASLNAALVFMQLTRDLFATAEFLFAFITAAFHAPLSLIAQ